MMWPSCKALYAFVFPAFTILMSVSATSVQQSMSITGVVIHITRILSTPVTQDLNISPSLDLT
jgi:hypothetical protein